LEGQGAASAALYFARELCGFSLDLAVKSCLAAKDTKVCKVREE